MSNLLLRQAARWGFCSETLAIYTAATNKPPLWWLKNVDRCIRRLKASGVWAKLNGLAVFLAPDSQVAKLNWVNPAGTAIVTSGTVTFTAYTEAHGDGSAGYATFFGLSNNGGVSSDGNNSLGVLLVAEGDGNIVFGSSTANARFGATNGGGASIRLNSSTGWFPATSGLQSSVGFFVVNQTSTGSLLELFTNAVSQGTTTKTHSADNTALRIFGNIGGSYSTQKIGLAFQGASLTAQQVSDFNAAIWEFLTAVYAIQGIAQPLQNFPNSGYTAINGENWSMQSANQSYSGGYAANPAYPVLRVEIHNGDTWSGDGERVEIIPDNVIAVGTEFWAAYASLLVPSFNYSDWNINMGQIHDSSGTGPNPPCAINQGSDGKIELRTCDDTVAVTQYTAAAAAEQNVFHNWVHYFKMGPSGNGRWKAWLNGALLADITARIDSAADTGTYLKVGVYRDPISPGTSKLFHANIEYGTTDLTDRILHPLPVPHGPLA